MAEPTTEGLGPCELWQGSRSEDGYGRLYVGGRPKPHYRHAHRVAWERANGPIPDGMLVCHRCDNPSCVRLDHLFVGTAADNNHDRDRKGRSAPLPSTRARAMRAKSSGLGNAKIDPATAQSIRAAIGSQRDIARRFGMSQSQVCRIRRGEAWA